MAEIKKTPFFSIVLGTKNRPDLLRDTMRSVMLQDFGGFEFIVSDNWNDERTKKTIDAFSHDPRVRYVRPDRELNIPDHWEFITRKAKGKYVLVLTDRMLLRACALGRIANIIKEYAPQGIEAYSWTHELFDGNDRFMRPVDHSPGGTIVCSSEDLLRKYARTGLIDSRFPQLPNACYDRRLGERIRTKHGRLIFPIAPDCTANFLMLFYTDRIVSIREPLMVAQTAANSNGATMFDKGPEVYFDTLGIPNLYRYTPIKAPLIQCLNFEDFLVITHMVGKASLLKEVDWSTYFMHGYEEIVYFGWKGYMKRRKKEFMDAWEAALKTFPADVQDAVRRKMPRTRLVFLAKSILANNPLTPFLRSIQGIIQYRSPRKHYQSALAAAGFPNA